MMTKDSSYKQIIVSMDNNNRAKFMASSNLYITNLNRTLKNIKSDVMTDFIRKDQHGIIITTNKVVLTLELQTIEKYIHQ